MLYFQTPSDFSPAFQVAACYITCGREILYLQRHEKKTYGGRWGIPGGKMREGEYPSDGIVREVYEETGLIFHAKEFEFLGKVYVRYPEYDFEHNVFHITLPQKFRIALSLDEHAGFTWVTPEKALLMPLIQDEDQSVRYFFRV